MQLPAYLCWHKRRREAEPGVGPNNGGKRQSLRGREQLREEVEPERERQRELEPAQVRTTEGDGAGVDESGRGRWSRRGTDRRWERELAGTDMNGVNGRERQRRW